MKHNYRLTQLGASSAKYGNCEICGKSTSDVYLQVKQHEMTLPGKSKTHIINDSATFGCQECLKSIRSDNQ